LLKKTVITQSRIPDGDHDLLKQGSIYMIYHRAGSSTTCICRQAISPELKSIRSTEVTLAKSQEE